MTVKATLVLSTLPYCPAVEAPTSDREALRAGLAFLEGASRWARKDLIEWFCTYGDALGRQGPPLVVLDSIVGTASLEADGPDSSRPGKLSRLMALARWQVVLTLSGLLSTPADDRFLHAAIFSQRVERAAGAWCARAGDGDALSDIVLSLFVVDILTHREFHEQNLCICAVCGRVSFNPRLTTRSGCTDHVPGSEATSGVQMRDAPES